VFVMYNKEKLRLDNVTSCRRAEIDTVFDFGFE